MSAIIPVIVRLLALFGVNVSPFVVGMGLSALALLGGGIALKAASHAGYAKAAGVCQQKALEAKNAALTIERDSLSGRSERAEARVREMGDILSRREEENRNLADQLKLRQSTKQGAKREPTALIDDQCNITDTGRRRLR